ncbi:MAG: hypothetical protein RLN72_07515 [Henriciella sp.]
MADIFEEVEEGLRQDRAAKLWKKYGVFAYLAAGLLIGGVALNEYLQHSRAQSVEANAMQFEAGVDALGEQNWQEAITALEQLEADDVEISPLAANYLAQARLEGTADLAASIEALEAAANTDTPIGKLSLMKAAYLKSNSMTRAEVETYLGGLADDESAFGALALELIAAKAVAEGDIEYARTTFNELRFLANVPQGVEQRSRAALAALPPAASTPSTPDETAPAETGQTTQDETGPGAGATDGDQPE